MNQKMSHARGGDRGARRVRTCYPDLGLDKGLRKVGESPNRPGEAWFDRGGDTLRILLVINDRPWSVDFVGPRLRAVNLRSESASVTCMVLDQGAVCSCGECEPAALCVHVRALQTARILPAVPRWSVVGKAVADV